MDNLYKSYNLKNLKEIIENTAKLYPDKILYDTANKKISFVEVYNIINRFGTALCKLELINRNTGIISENRYEWEISFLTVSIGGGIIVPFDKEYTQEEIENVILNTNIEVIMCSKKYLKIIEKINTKIKKLKKIIVYDKCDSIEEDVVCFEKLVEYGENLINNGFNLFLNYKVNDKKCSFVFCTSGTTKSSKAVMLSHENICSNLNNMAKIINLSSKDKALSILPLNHVLEGIFSFLLCIYKGATRCYSTSIDNIFADIDKYNITFVAAVPAIYKYMYQVIEADNSKVNILKKVKTLFCAGARLDENLKENYRLLGINLLQGYGLTETSTAISLDQQNILKPRSVGKIIDGIELKIINKDKNGIGEILVKGKNVMLGYYNDEVNTKQAIKRNWFYTGDLGKVDEDGYVYLYARKKDLIVLSNGKKVFPSEIEELINKIKYVEESFVFEYNDEIYAKLVYLKESFVDNKVNIDKYFLNEIEHINNKLPIYKRIKSSFISTRPNEKTNSMKINRNIERNKLIEEFNLKNKYKIKLEENLKIKEIVFSTISSILDIDINDIKLNDRLKFDLNADSLDIAQIKLELEKELNKNINNTDFKSVITVGDIIKIC